ncbi:hypothetical protein LPTSP4_35970 [Leptospira ryugenii]|uniref:Type II toxin-antitoxin system HicA family toxin n=1 Tax=Leptospira ryugenii TaxID=1917863 RepID=A0A2P2E5A6_9LEPT|nr:hypothetical protein [Leptospira ryugenii]GBF52059.1 hypothetical protein LPTSP4_35970 [Leptospira ryugenii]
MGDIERDKIESSLIKKGFKLIESHHRFYYFEHNGILTSIRTKISTGSSYKTYNDSLIAQLKKQLKFNTKKELLDFINCPMTAEEYKELLTKNNQIT